MSDFKVDENGKVLTDKSEETVEDVIKSTELYWMARDHFDSESVELMVEELVEKLETKFGN